MRTRVIGLLLAVMATVLLMAPPKVEAYVNEPMFGMSWTPDLCNNPYGVYFCLNLYLYISDLNNAAIDRVWHGWDGIGLFGCIYPYGTGCFSEEYRAAMEPLMSTTCDFFFQGGSSETTSWCYGLYQMIMSEALNQFGNGSGGGCGACITKLPRNFSESRPAALRKDPLIQ